MPKQGPLLLLFFTPVFLYIWPRAQRPVVLSCHGWCFLRDDSLNTWVVAQRSCGCPLPGSVQGQVGWSSEQHGLVEDVPADGRGVGTR